ncbi:MAG: ribosomal protein S18-alanine N-acetyltransferase [Oscillospiraceae bacterium]|nr:ribosomal protein S18-alanine N-acetyltransferase [Oscillospiraceae bacterium]
MNYEIVPVTEEMLDMLEEIEKECFSEPWNRDALRWQMSGNNIFLAAVQNGEVMGYIGMMTVLDEGYIGNVAVTGKYRRMGVAKQLIRALEARCREMQMSFMTLEVRESNIPAISLYASFGFEEVGVRKNYYDKPRENAILMTRNLD